MSRKYTMTISRLTVDKLGVKLYDRVSAVIAEIVANSYDADATNVIIRAPMGEWLASKSKGIVTDAGHAIEVEDNGSGMTVEEVNEFYLKVGKERRNDPKRGDVSKNLNRRVMGRKGVGKLAPFGVCERIEVITAGGRMQEYVDTDGRTKSGYQICHLILERGAILNETDEPYYPIPGFLDCTYRSDSGTIIKMTSFDHRRVPAIEDFERQMAQRFGLKSANWSIILQDSLKQAATDGHERTVGEFQVSANNATKITFCRAPDAKEDSRSAADYVVVGPQDVPLTGLQPGFLIDDKFYPVTGWAATPTSPTRMN